MEREKLHRLLRLGIEKGASDIHFQVGYLPLYRFNGDLVELRYKVLTARDTEAIARLVLEGESRELPDSFDELDLAFELPGQRRRLGAQSGQPGGDGRTRRRAGLGDKVFDLDRSQVEAPRPRSESAHDRVQACPNGDLPPTPACHVLFAGPRTVDWGRGSTAACPRD